MNSAKVIHGMQMVYKLSAALLVTIYFSFAVQKPVYAQQENVSMQVFYDELTPYGQWIDYPNFGYVWIPDVSQDFVPYSTDGHWVMTNYGWTWVSDYPWGWAPFHYGRWDFNNDLGWFWIPDYEWGPAWVTWRRANGYYGWAPMRPGISVSLSFSSGYRDLNGWCFVRDRDFGRPDINRYYLDRRDYDPIIRNSIVINNTYVDNRRHVTYIAGPPREDVQRNTGRRISAVTIMDNNRPGHSLSNNELRIYRPQIQKSASFQKPAPSRISNFKDVRPMKERNVNPQRNNVAPIERREEKKVEPQQQIEQRRQEQIQQQVKPQQRIEQPKQEQQKVEPRQPAEVRKQEQIQQPQKSMGQQRREQRQAQRAQRRTQPQQQKEPDHPSNEKEKK